MVESYSLIFIISLHTPSHSLILSTSGSVPLDSLRYAHRVNTRRCFPQIDDWLIAKADPVREEFAAQMWSLFPVEVLQRYYAESTTT